MFEGQLLLDVAKRYRQVKAWALSTSAVVVGAIILLVALAVAGWLLYSISRNNSGVWLGWLCLATAAAASAATLFIFGSTYYPAIPPKRWSQRTAQAGQVNVSEYMVFSLAALFAPDIVADEQTGLQRLLACLGSDTSIKTIQQRLQIRPEDAIAAIAAHVMPHLTWPTFLENVVSILEQMNGEYITAVHVWGALLLHPQLKNWLRQQGYREEDIIFVLRGQQDSLNLQEKHRRWWDSAAFRDFQGLGLSWASGFTPFVDRFNHIPIGNVWDVPLFHEEQVEQLLTTLARKRDSNVLLVGQPGVGRLGVVKGVVDRIRRRQTHPVLANERILYMHLGQLMGLGVSGPQQYAVISRALAEMERAGNIILVLDGLGALLGDSSGSLNVTDALVPFFSSVTVRVIVLMSNEEYHLRLKANEELIHFFEVVHVPELSADQTLRLLTLLAPTLEKESGIYIPYRPLRELVEDTDSILPEIPFPEKAFDILEEALVALERQNVSVLTETDLSDLLSKKVGVNLGQVKDGERAQLLQLDELIHRRVVNQTVAVAAVVRSMIRARAQVRTLSRPIGTFLFLGPTGVGKTETAKALAESYFGLEERMLRLDMSEFQDAGALVRLIGGDSQNSGLLTTMIADHPFSVFLLDEFEKAHRSVQQLFLQVFDEGQLHDSRGRRFSFKHTMIIATSNAGAEFIRATIEEQGSLPEHFDQQLRNYVLQQEIFRPELLNRFDGVITFTPLSVEHIRQVALLMLRKLNSRLDQEHGITVAITPQLIDFLVAVGYDPQFGARPMNRAIQDTVEYAVAERIIRGNAAPGEEITLSPEALKV